MSQDLQDTNITISPPPRQQAPVAPTPAPVFQPAPVIVPTQHIAQQPVIVQQPQIAQSQPVIVQQRQPTPQQPIIVQQQPAPAPQPVYVAPAPAPSPQPIYVTSESSPAHTHKSGKSTTTAKVHHVTTTKEKHTAPKSKSTHKVNWGGVVKGVAVVSAIALAGVGLYYGGAAVTEWALANPTVNGIVGSIGTFIEPAVTWITNAGNWLAGFITEIPHMIGNFFSGAFGSVGLGNATVNIGTSAATVGTIAAGAGIAGASAHLLPHLDHTTLMTHGHTIVPGTDQVHVTSTVTTDPVVTHHAAKHASSTSFDMALDSDMSNDIASQNIANAQAAHASTHAHAAHDVHQAAELGHHSMHLSHMKMKHAALHGANADTQQDIGDASNDVAAPDVDIDEADIAKFSQRQPRSSWRNLLSGGRKTSESHASNVSKRNSEFASALDADRAKLEALTADAQR